MQFLLLVLVNYNYKRDSRKITLNMSAEAKSHLESSLSIGIIKIL